MYEWQQQIQIIINEIDASIKRREDGSLTLNYLARLLGYSDYHFTKRFHAITGLSFRTYLRTRRLAFALVEVRDTNHRLLDIALDYGFSSHEAFSRAFKAEYGVSPTQYRKNPVAVALRTRFTVFDRYALGLGEIGMIKSTGKINVYFTTIPAHKFIGIRNNVTAGYWNFWQYHNQIEGQDCQTICGLMDSIPGRLDDLGTAEDNAGGGHIMAYENASDGGSFDCYPVPRWECYGCRLPYDYQGPIPEGMYIRNVPEGEYIVFEHGPFDYEHENRSVEAAIDQAWDSFDWSATDYEFDSSEGRMYYFYHDPDRYWKEVWPVRRKHPS